MRDTSEVDAVFDCFLQLRVTPPDDFPISEEKRRHREDRLQARQARQQRRKEKESDQKGEKEEKACCPESENHEKHGGMSHDAMLF